jgi:hypothetical protein
MHPNGFVLEEFLLSLSKEHLDVVDHLTQCPACQEQVQILRRSRPSPVTERLAEVLRWPGEPADYSASLQKSGNVVRNHNALLKKERAEAPGLFV